MKETKELKNPERRAFLKTAGFPAPALAGGTLPSWINHEEYERMSQERAEDKRLAKRVRTSDGFDLYYWVTWKPGMNKPFTILHPGASLNHTSLQSLERGLNAKGYPTINFDQRGIGYSEAPLKQECYTLDKHSSDLQRIIEQEGLENPEFITHSFGFMIAANYAFKNKTAGRIVGIGASHNFVETRPSFVDYLGNLGEYLECLEYGVSSIKHFLSGEETRYPNQNLAGKSDISVALSIADVPLRELKAHFLHGRELGKWDVSQQLKSIDNPIQLIHGKNDFFVLPCAVDKIAALTKKKCEINLVEGTHALPVTHPERVLELIR